MEMKRLIVLSLVFSLMVLSGSLFAETGKKGEICFAGGFFFSDGCSAALGAASLGYYYKIIGAEVNGAVIGGGGIMGGNLFVGLFDNQVLAPYATWGIWATTCGGLGFNAGGGIKVKPSELFAIRAEYRRYFVGGGDWGINAIIGGISLFF
jgi:hypothetical protein